MPKKGKKVSQKKRNRVNRIKTKATSSEWKRNEFKLNTRIFNKVSRNIGLVAGPLTNWYVPVRRSKKSGIGLVKGKWYLPYVLIDRS